jgi:hypothetical protein
MVERGADQPVDDFYARLLTRGDARPVVIGAP